MNDMIQTENLSKRFRSTPALDEATLLVPEGAIYALVGANGAGKTTLIKLLMNIFRPTSGRAQVMGIECRQLAGRDFQRIGYVSENQEMPDWMGSWQGSPSHPGQPETSLCRPCEMPLHGDRWSTWTRADADV
jgi:ABC-type multidrug transport system ATPase subunit